MPDPARIPEHLSVLESLNRDHFTAEELADVLGVSTSVVREAVRRGELNGYIVEHRIVDIPRTAAIAWLKQRMEDVNKPLRQR
ncbi:MAG TPA: helix-turn-helix domain-containing protein [Thermomicrobiales bacterium]|nr:helix-turn-helix domain-containing protein [Thermomicrobiales bacterium]